MVYDNIKFPSEIERDFYIKLKRLKYKGKIKDFEMQVEFEMLPSFKDFNGKKIEKVIHKPDYKVYLNDGTWILIDTKGNPEDLSILKRKILLHRNPGVKYYFVSILPKYLGGHWVEVTKNYDFRKKLKLKYTRKHGKWQRNKPNWTTKVWDKYFEYEDISGLFYRWNKTKKIKK